MMNSVKFEDMSAEEVSSVEEEMDIEDGKLKLLMSLGWLFLFRKIEDLEAFKEEPRYVDEYEEYSVMDFYIIDYRG